MAAASSGGVETFDPPYLGFDSQSLPVQLGKGMGERSVNLLPGRTGLVQVRGGMSTSIADRSPAARPTFVWTHTAGALVRTAAGAKLVASDLTSASTVALSGLANLRPASRRFVNVGAYTYGISEVGRNVLAWNGGTTTSDIVGVSGAPFSGVVGYTYHSVAQWLNRLWILASFTASVHPSESVQLYWSDQYDTSGLAPSTAAGWQDDVSGLTNQIDLDVHGQDGQPVASEAMGRHHAIFFTNAVHVLRGTSKDDFQLRRELTGVGAVSEDAIMTHEDGVLFVGREGLYFYDGVTLDELSSAIRVTFASLPFTSAQIMRVDRNNVLVQLNNSTTTLWCGLLHLPSRGWTTIAGSASIFNGGLPTYIVNGPSLPLLLDDTRTWDASPIVRPLTSVARGRDVDSTGAGYPIVAEAVSRLARLATPVSKSQLRRYICDYIQQPVTTVDAAAGWTFSVVDATEATTFASQPAATTPDTTAVRARNFNEAYAETDEVKLRHVFTGSATVDYRGELHECFVEYQASRASS